MTHLPVILLLVAAAALGVAPQRFRGGYMSPEEVHEAVREVAARADTLNPSRDAEALYQLALLHERGYDTIPQDSARALRLMRLAAEGGYLPAQNYLGYLLINSQSPEDGLHWLERAAIAGDLKAQSNIGFLLLEGDLVKRDDEKALFWLSRAAAGGMPQAASMLGDLYRDGRGVAQDSTLAAANYMAAYEHGLADAAYKLEEMMSCQWSAMPDDMKLTTARYLYNRTAPDVAIPLLRQLAENGNAEGLALLGDAYTRARGVAYDHDRAVECYFKAAQAGNPSAQFIIAEMLEIFPDALSAYGDFSAADFREAARQAGVTTAEEASRRLLNPPKIARPPFPPQK